MARSDAWSVFRLRTESVDVQLPGGQRRTVPSSNLRLEGGFMVETA